LIGSAGSLANTGQIAFAAIAQLAPAMFGALIWKHANRTGVDAGLFVGMSLWFLLLVLPLLGFAAEGDWPVLSRLYEDAFGPLLVVAAEGDWPVLGRLCEDAVGMSRDANTLGSISARSGNFLIFVVVSMVTRTRVVEHWQASRCVSRDSEIYGGSSRAMLRVT